MKPWEWEKLGDKGWAYGSDNCPIFEPVEKICIIGARITKKCEELADSFLGIEPTKFTAMTFPKVMEINDLVVEIIGLFEVLCITCYEPSEKDLPQETPEKEPEKESVATEPEEIEEIFKMVSKLDEKNIEVKREAAKLKAEKKNPFVALKDTIKTVKTRIDIKNIYGNVKSINEAQATDYIIEVQNTLGFIFSTLQFAKSHYPNKYGIRIAVLYFMDIVPEPIKIAKKRISL